MNNPQDILIHCAHTELVEIDKLVEHSRNPNKHPESQIKLLAKIIKAQGFRNPIVVSKRSGFIIKGHGRLAAARLLEMERVPVDVQDYENEAAEWADMIADNKIAELSENDDEELKALLAELDGQIDIELTGFDLSAIDQFDVEETELPDLPSDDKSPFKQMTFTLHNAQVEEVEAAMKKAKAAGGGESAVNENRNGNAIAWICSRFIEIENENRA
jgi:ParB-like chromosome segregation protein Spo0J